MTAVRAQSFIQIGEATMNTYCPECETELDQTTGVCPACRWDPYLVAPKPTKVPKFEGSIADRYRGTPYDSQWQTAAAERSPGISRARVFVITMMLGVGAFYGVILAVMGGD
jgi:hypothetical protein